MVSENSKKFYCKTIMVMVFFSVCILLILNMTGCLYLMTAKEVIEHTAEIDMPNEAKEVYYLDGGGALADRNPQLIVFEFDNDPKNWLKEKEFISSDDTSLTTSGDKTLVENNKEVFMEYFGFTTIKKEEIPIDYIPNFNEKYLCLEKNLVFFYYYPEKLRLIVYISASVPLGDKFN